LCLALGSQMVDLGGKAKTIDEAKDKLNENLSNGRAFEFFKRMLESQGGDISVVDHPEQLAQSEYKIELPAKSSATILNVMVYDVEIAASMIGAGRTMKDSVMDLADGLVQHKKIGGSVGEAESLLTIYSNRQDIQEVKE